MENQKATELDQIIFDLNRLLWPLRGVKIRSWSELHDAVKTLLQEHCFMLGFEVNTWGVRLLPSQDSGMNYERCKLFKYELKDFVKDKRYRYNTVGVIGSIVFSKFWDLKANTFAEYKLRLRKLDHAIRLRALLNYKRKLITDSLKNDNRIAILNLKKPK